MLNYPRMKFIMATSYLLAIVLEDTMKTSEKNTKKSNVIPVLLERQRKSNGFLAGHKPNYLEIFSIIHNEVLSPKTQEGNK